MVTFLLGLVVASMVYVPLLLFVVWMWKTDTRLLTRLWREERDASMRVTRMWTQGTTTRATGEGRTIHIWDETRRD